MVLPLAHLAALIALGAEPRPLPKVIADLGSPEFEVREAASAELFKAGETYKLAELEKALTGAGLSPEQRVRLDDAAFRIFENSPRAAIGVQFAQGTVAAEVEWVKEGFPASTILKPRDVITQIDGQNVASRIGSDGSWLTVRALIVSHDPGDKVPVVVQRDGAAVSLTLPLGEFQRLGQTTPVSSPELRAAWLHRLRRSAGTTGEKATGTIDATSLRTRGVPFDGEGRPIDVVDQSTDYRAQNGESPSVVAGAAPDRSKQTERFDAQASGLQRFNNGGGWAVGGGNFRFAPLDSRELARMSDADLTAERLRLFQQAQVYMMFAEQRGGGGGRGPQARQFNELLNQTQQQLDAVTAEINKRKAARQDEKQPKPVPAIAPDDQKPDQKADKP
jgi:hypothetical protein